MNKNVDSLREPARGVRDRWAASGLVALLAAGVLAPAWCGPVPFPTQTTAVTLDGVPIGQPLHPASLNSLRYTIAFNPGDGLYHLWVLDGADTATPAGMRVADIMHATSSNGHAFASKGKLNPPASWWTQLPGVGATSEPSVNFLRIDLVSSEWLLTIWSPNETNTGLYNYNANVWDLGIDINNLNVVQHGPLPSLSEIPTGPGGNMVGSFGMANGKLYLRQDTQFNSGPPVNPARWGGGIGRYLYTDGVRPTLSPVWGTSEADLFTGTAYCWVLPYGGPNQCTAFPSLKPSYVHNSGRVIPQGSALDAYYTFRDATTAARQDKQIYFVESANDGATWTPAAGVYVNGNAVLVDGLPNAANFSSPELVNSAAGFRTYFSTADTCGNLIVVTAEDPANPKGPTVAKKFGQSLLPPNGTTTLAVTLAAPTATCAPAPSGAVFTQVGFTDSLPSGMVLGTPAIASNTCGGTLTAVAGASSFGLVNAGLSAGQTCTVVVNVTVTTPDIKVNLIARNGGSPTVDGFFNQQGAAALADAVDAVTVGTATTADIPTLSELALSVLAVLLLGLGRREFAVRRKR